MSLKTAVKVVLELMGISILLFCGFYASENVDVKSLLVSLLALPICFILLVYIPILFVMLMVKLFPNHKELRYLPAVLAVDGILFLIHRQLFDNSVNKEFSEVFLYLLMAVFCFITFISSFIAAKSNLPYKKN